MNRILESLITIQDLQFKAARQPHSKEEMVRLRSTVPAPVLAHFDRMLARGKKGVAIVRKGVCSGCHLKVSSGTMASLARAESIHLCDSCGRYLYLPPETETVHEAPPPPLPAKVRKPRRKPELALV